MGTKRGIPVDATVSQDGELVLFHNNPSFAWTGRNFIKRKHGGVTIRRARPFRAGLSKGAGHYIGWKSVRVTGDMVGSRLAVFVSKYEIKTEMLTLNQQAFVKRVKAGGGIVSTVTDSKL